MLRKKVVNYYLIAVMGSGFLFMNAGEGFARDRDVRRGHSGNYSGRHSFHQPHHPYYGNVVTFPEIIARTIVHAGFEYHYSRGYFYRRANRGYVVVDAPYGIIVDDVPAGYKIIRVRGKNYYYYNSIYYVRAQRGYMVVEDPVYQVVEFPQEVKVIETVPTIEVATPVETSGEFTVNIPNGQGGYTPVLIKKSGSGFVGPQGEYYEKFPSVAQLKVMYGK